MPYANVDDRRRRVNARRLERLEEYRAYARARYRMRKADPAFLAKRSAQALVRKRAKQELVDSIKLGRGCADCGYNADPRALDFDHVHGKKSFAIAESKHSPKVLLAEIEKCEVVCANCHRIRTCVRGAA